MILKVTGDVTIRYEKKEYRKGAEFEADKATYERIQDLVEVVSEESADAENPADENDSKGLTIAEIKEILDRQGIEYDPKAKKADLQSILDGIGE